jgi:hypothetical protein
MTTQRSPDKAMDALVAARPTSENLEQAWYIGRSERVLQEVLTAPYPQAGCAVVHRRNTRRRWALLAAATA